MQGWETIKKGSRRRLGWGGLVTLGFIGVLLWGGTAMAATVAPSYEKRSDLIVIDILKSHGPLERPAVRFYHDKHTEALAKQKKDCVTCHSLVKNNRLSPAFDRTETMTKQMVMETFHDRCIGCHQEAGMPDQPSGPVTCGECHIKDADQDILWAPIDLDKSLHYRHVLAMDQKCEQCHHQYDEQTQKLIYVKGQEGACLYCHREKAEENRISTQSASHLACVGCHHQKAAANQNAGPLECAGCHDPGRQALIEKITDIPRIQRNQPDMVLVKTMPANRNLDTKVNMGVVAFNHKAHEGYTLTCKGCHHADQQSCAQCHTPQGDADGGQVRLAQAMHQMDATMSCVGCHNQQKEQVQCVGCHHNIPPARTLTSASACQTCHRTSPLEDAGALSKDQSAALAAEILSARKPVRGTVAVDQIPETVTIKSLAKDYQPVELPHRKMVLALAQVGQDNELAAQFHADPLTLCQGCHHNSPASLKPPQCGSCHGRTSEALNLTRPGLMAAYHQQCLECHTRMGIVKPESRECTACHAKR